LRFDTKKTRKLENDDGAFSLASAASESRTAGTKSPGAPVSGAAQGGLRGV